VIDAIKNAQLDRLRLVHEVGASVDGLSFGGGLAAEWSGGYVCCGRDTIIADVARLWNVLLADDIVQWRIISGVRETQGSRRREGDAASGFAGHSCRGGAG
jgi:hypothetical protein